MPSLRTIRYLVVVALLLPLVSVASAQKKGAATSCPAGEIVDPRGTGKCVKQVVCGPDQEAVLNRCFPKCPEGMTHDNQGKCQGCPTGQVKDPSSGKCAPLKVCTPDQVLIANKCFAKCPEGMTHDNQGKCQGCPTGQVKDVKTGKCAPISK
jgi:hypothetical protein